MDDLDAEAWGEQLDFLRSGASDRRKRMVLYTMNAERLFATALASPLCNSAVSSFLQWLDCHEPEEDDSDCVDYEDDMDNGIIENEPRLPISVPDFEAFPGPAEETPVEVPTAMSGLEGLHRALEVMQGRSEAVMEDTGFCSLPVEIGLAVMDELPFRARSTLGTTNRFNQTLVADAIQCDAIRLLVQFQLQYSMIRLLLTATAGAISGSAVSVLLRLQDPFVPSNLDFVVGWGHGVTVVDFLALAAGYVVRGTVEQVNKNGLHRVWTMTLGDLVIHVLEALSDSVLDAITFFHLTSVYGAWVAEGVWHGYPGLTTRGGALTNRSRFPIGRGVHAQAKVWETLHTHIERGFTIHLDSLDEPHICGSSVNCPATLRVSDDAGCSYNPFPTWNYTIDASDLPRTSWMLGGSGCPKGILAPSNGGGVSATASFNQPWVERMRVFMDAREAPLE